MQEQRCNSKEDFPHPLPVICPNCCASNARLQDFCRICATPLTAYATIAPLGQVYCQGDAYRKSVRNPYKPIIVIGIWLICGPIGVGSTCRAIAYAAAPFKGRVEGTGDWVATVLAVIFYGGAALIFDLILYRTTQNFFRLRHQMDDTDEPSEETVEDRTFDNVDRVAEPS